MLEDVEEEEVLLLVVVVVDDPAGVDAVVLGVDVDPDCCCCISKEGKHCSSVTHVIAFERYMYMSSRPLSLKLTFT